MINLGVEWLKEITSPKKMKTSIKDNSSGNGAQRLFVITLPRLDFVRPGSAKIGSPSGYGAPD